MSADISAGSLSGSTNVPSFTGSSFCVWIRMSSSSPTDYVLESVDDGVANFLELGRDGAGPTGSISLSTSTQINIRTHAQLANTWTWIAYSAGPTNTTAYYSLDGETIVTVGTVPSATGTPTAKYISTDSQGSGSFPGLIVGAKFFDQALTVDQLALEAIRFRPSISTNAWLPLLNGTSPGLDWGGVADMTLTGSFSTSRLMPPIPWKG